VLLHTAALLAWLAAAGQEATPGLDAGTERHVERGVAAVLALEEEASPGEWPYEGAIRMEGAIPIGFRVGGTGYVVGALAALPGLAGDEPRRAALGRGVTFLARALAEEGMSANALAGVDLRLWGLLTGARGLLAARAAGERGGLSEEELDRAVRDYLTRLAQLEIPRNGGWSYNRPSGRLLPSPPNSYVTADVLQVFFEARAQGFKVDPEPVERALLLLESQRQPTGAFLYSGTVPGERPPTIPGSVGRMLVCEVTLLLAGRSDVLHVRGALDAFLAHWDALEERRGRTGLHKPPHDIAPYHFLYAHVHASRAIELLPAADRPEYRARLAEKLERVRDEETGTWNDRVFKRSAAYGTAAAALALSAPLLAPLAGWTADE
jgi:hypothetical protein